MTSTKRKKSFFNYKDYEGDAGAVEGKNEEILLQLNPSWRSYLYPLVGPLFLIVLLHIGAVFLNFFNFLFFVFFAGLVVVYPLMIISVAIKKVCTSYIVTNKRICSKEGLFAKRKVEVDIKDIRSIETNQSILGRIFGFGNVLISTAGTGGVEVAIIGISKPNSFTAFIKKCKTN